MLGLLLALAWAPLRSNAITPLPTPPPQGGSYGIEATKLQPPPTDPATVVTPGSGGSYSTSPITVSGLCPDDVLVEVFDNGVMVGAVNCVNGSWKVQISLFTGTNAITAQDFDDLNQSGPAGNSITVSYNNSSFSAFGVLITLTSAYGRRAANPGTTLSWPLQLSGGTGPYAFSIDWGDGSAPQLKSQALGGEVDISHVYNTAGIYHVTVKVTDTNGVTAFLQLVAVANGQPAAASTSSSNGSSSGKTTTITKILWIPTIVAIALMLPTYWLGRRSELVTLHKQLEKNMEEYKEL